ncbi:MAG: hypothetical protein U1E03_06345 [Hyphomonadaceae bacterium]
MTEHVISHHGPRGKRGSAWGHAARVLGALALTAAALLVANWLAPLVRHSDLTKTPSVRIDARTPAPPPATVLEDADVTIDLAAPRREAQRRPRPAPTGIPLDANGHLASDGFEVLSAAELDAISQARN